jgi:hypothetical protein
MPERYELTFEQPDGVNGAVRVDLTEDHAAYWTYLDLVTRGAGFVAIRHDQVGLPRGRLLELRGDGLWAELVCEVAGEHWTFGLEAFALRFESRDEARTAQLGERVPMGFDLEWDGGRVIGELLVGRERIAFDGHGSFTHDASAAAPLAWAAWLDELPALG